jgi:hypothetical protein
MSTAIAAGLLYTIGMPTQPLKPDVADTLYKDKDTSDAKLIGCQILLGLGAGPTLQNSVVACQTEVKNDRFIREYN